MYTITRMRDGSFWCEARIQDGMDRWSEPTEEKAVQSMIRFARLMNGSYITKEDISFQKLEPEPLSHEDLRLLQLRRSGQIVYLRRDDPRIKYRITPEECEMIVKIREGELIVQRKT